MTLAEEEGAEDKLIKSLTGEAVKSGLRPLRATPTTTSAITEQFMGNLTFPAGDDLPRRRVRREHEGGQGPAPGRERRWRRKWSSTAATPRRSRASASSCSKGSTSTTG